MVLKVEGAFVDQPRQPDPLRNTAQAVPRWSPIQLLTRSKGIYFGE